MSLIQPALQHVNYQATNMLCLNRLKQFTMATLMFADDNNGLYPDRGIDNMSRGEPLWARWAM